MKKRIRTMLLTAAAAFVGACLLTVANCQPYPYCEYEACLVGGGVCMGLETRPCSIGWAQPCYQEYWCESAGYVYIWEGADCCGSC